MSATRWLVGAVVAAGLLLTVDVDLAVVSANPRAALVFAAFWLTLLAYPPYLRRARWFDAQNYSNLAGVVIPVMSATGAAFGLVGVATADRVDHWLGVFTAGNTFVGIGVLGLAVVLGLPALLSARHRGERPHRRAATSPQLEEIIDRALELDAANPPKLNAADLQELADIVDVPLATLRQAALELSDPGMIHSRPPPTTQVEGDDGTNPNANNSAHLAAGGSSKRAEPVRGGKA